MRAICPSCRELDGNLVGLLDDSERLKRVERALVLFVRATRGGKRAINADYLEHVRKHAEEVLDVG